MKNIFWILFFFFSFFQPILSQQYLFKQYGVEDGLSQNTVWSILQDSRGFLWFGTKDGLNRFDGKTFKTFRHVKGDPTSIGNNFIHSLWEDENKMIWVGTEQGIFIYNPENEEFKPFTKKVTNNVSINGIVSSITKDKRGNIWIASFFTGVFVYNPHKDLLQYFQHNSSNPNSLSSNLVWTIYCDSKGDIWLGTHMGGLNKYDFRKKQFIRYLPNHQKNCINDDNVYSIFEDSQGNFWIGTGYGGLNLMDRQNETFEYFKSNTSGNSVSNNLVRCILEILPGKLFIGTETGLDYFELRTQKFTNFVHSESDSKSICDNAIYSIYKDAENNIWIGTYFGGVNFLSVNKKQFEFYYPDGKPNRLHGKAVSVFCEDAKGNIWVGTEDGGLNYFDVTTKLFTSYPLNGKTGTTNIHALIIDKDKLWIGSLSEGIIVLDLKTKKIKNYRYEKNNPRSLGFTNIFSIYKDRADNIWVGGIFGLCRYNRSTDDFTRINDLGLNNIYIFDILQDNIGYIWFASYNDGIFCLNPKTNQWKQYHHNPEVSSSIASNKVISIYQDHQNRLWFGTEGAGLCQYIYDKDSFITYNENNNLPNNVIYSILDDGLNLWISSNKGITRFDPVTFKSRSYHETDGLQSDQFNNKACMRSRDGKLYFGGIKGFNAFYPHLLMDNDFVPPIVFTNFQILNNRVPIGTKNSPLKKSISFTHEITLDYNQSVFSLEFVSLSFLAPKNNRYAYKLEGFDVDWNYTQETKITYTGLPSGTYTLKVKASNNDGKWNEKGITLKIIILPPFWKSPTAYVIYFILFIIIFIIGSYYLQKRSILRNKKELERINAGKEKELNQMKIDFFTNIAHEIRSPLSLIIGPLNNLISSGKGSNEVKEDYQIIKRNALRLLTLVNQLLDFRKIESKKYIVRYSKTDLVGFVKSIYERYSLLAKDRNIEFTFNSNFENWETTISVDALSSVIGNLLSNAFKFTRNKIELTILISDKYYELSVIDNGYGVHPQETEKIFMPFYQEVGENKVRKLIEGTGLGLAYVKSLVELQEGKVFVDKNYLDGAKFVVNIPFKNSSNIALFEYDKALQSTILDKINVESSFQNLKQLSNENQMKIIDTTGRLSILIVEDNEELLQFVSGLFSKKYTVFKSKNGLEALKIIEDEEIDLVISDVMMPEMDGFEMCTSIKTNFTTSHIPVILLTAKTTVESRITGLKHGADAYIEKPFEPEHLLIQASNLLENRKKLRLHFIQEPFVKIQEIVGTQPDEKFILNIERIIEEKLNDPSFTIDELAREVHISRSGLHKKLKGISGLTPNDFIKLIRLKKSAELLKTSQYRINEVCYMVGFNTPSYFAKCFQEQFGMLPTDFLSTKENKE